MVFYQFPEGEGFNPLFSIFRLLPGRRWFFIDTPAGRSGALINAVFSSLLGSLLFVGMILSKLSLDLVAVAATTAFAWHIVQFFFGGRTCIATNAEVAPIGARHDVYLFEWCAFYFSMIVLALAVERYAGSPLATALFPFAAILLLVMLFIPLLDIAKYRLQHPAL